MRRVFLSRRAKRDLDSIWNHIADDSVEAADRIANALLDTAGMLGDAPFVGRARPELVDGVRSLVLSNTPYVIFYQVGAERVDIVRILHGARDFRPELFE